MERIRVSHIGKKYKRYLHRWGRVAEWVLPEKFQFHESVWVLRDIDFTVHEGESVGIIGQNGAGKSTLLKILTGTTKATEGSAVMHGRVSALLELGMGFHSDFTGRQNAIMGGQLLGMSTQEVLDLMPEIEDFAEIGDYMDQPVRTYSSGMQVRLAFSVATALRPDILIVDEALSVGDAYFQHKCFERIKKFKELGTTLLFVSHDPAAVKNLCNRAVLIEKGKKVMEGNPAEVLDYYNAAIAVQDENYVIQQVRNSQGELITRSGSHEASIEYVKIYKDAQEGYMVPVGEDIELRIGVLFREAVENPTVGILFRDRIGNEIFGTNSHYLDQESFTPVPGQVYEYVFSLKANFGVGHYSVTVAVHAGAVHTLGNYDWWDRAAILEVIPGNHYSFIGVNYLPVAVRRELVKEVKA